MDNVDRDSTAAHVLRHMLDNQDITAAHAGNDSDEDAREALDLPMMVPVWGPATLFGRDELLASVREDFGDESNRPVWVNQWITSLIPTLNAGRDSYVEVGITPRQYLDGEALTEKPTAIEYNTNGPEILRLVDRRHGDDSPVAFTIESRADDFGWIVQAEHGNPSVDDALKDLWAWYPAPDNEEGARP